MYCGKWLDRMTEEEYINACLFIDLHFFYVYPEFEHDLESIHEKFRYLILKKGVDGVMIDPFNQLDKNQKAYERDDQYISNTMKDVKRFALLNAVSYNIIMHPKSPTYNQDKSLPVVDMYDIAGGAMTGNKADQIISYYRPNFHIDKNDSAVQVYMQKVKRKRTGGKLGSVNLRLEWNTKRYSDDFGNIFCDPKRAEKLKTQEESGMMPDDKLDNSALPF
jgi:twinkle protein